MTHCSCQGKGAGPTTRAPTLSHACVCAAAEGYPPAQGGSITIADFAVYKSKAAVTIKLIKPSWKNTLSASGNQVFAVDRYAHPTPPRMQPPLHPRPASGGR